MCLSCKVCISQFLFLTHILLVLCFLVDYCLIRQGYELVIIIRCIMSLQAIEPIPEISETITYMDFMHAYALVISRAWESTKGVSLVSLVDELHF